MLDFLESIAFESIDRLAVPTEFRNFTIPVERAIYLQPTQPATQPFQGSSGSVSVVANTQPARNGALINQIANEFYAAREIVRACHPSNRSLARSTASYSPGSTDEALANIVMDIMDHAIDNVPMDQPLSELGLSSLQMVMLLGFSADLFAPKISSDQLFSNLDEFAREPTLRKLKLHLQRLVAKTNAASAAIN